MSQEIVALHKKYCGEGTQPNNPKARHELKSLFKGITSVGLGANLSPFEITDATTPPQSPYHVPWNYQTIPGLGSPERQEELYLVIANILVQNGQPDYIGQTAIVPATPIGHIGPFLTMNPKVCHTTGELNYSLITTLIMENIQGYRAYRSIKRSRYRSDVYDDEDQQFLLEFPFLGAVLRGDVPTPEFDLTQVAAKLRQMRDNLLTSVKGLVNMEPQFSASNVPHDPTFIITKEDLIQNNQWLGNSYDTITPLIRASMDGKYVHMYDLLCVMSDAVKAISESSRQLSTNDLNGVQRVITLVSSLSGLMKKRIANNHFSPYAERDQDIKEELFRGKADIERRIYISLVRSMGRILKRACDEYEVRKNSHSPQMASPGIHVSKYQGVVNCARQLGKALVPLNEELASRSIQPINNDSCKDMVMLADIVSRQIGKK